MFQQMTGSQLRELRLAKRLKSGELAAFLDINPATMSRYENSHAPIPAAVALATRYICQDMETPPSHQLAAGVRLIELLKEVLSDVEYHRHGKPAGYPAGCYGSDQVSVAEAYSTSGDTGDGVGRPQPTE